jgi:hypothetical protein
MIGLGCRGAGAVGDGAGTETGGAFAAVGATGGVLLQAAKKTMLPERRVQVRKCFMKSFQ